MSKQLITLIGALVSAAVIVAAVLLGVVPLVGGVFTAQNQREQVASTNATYEAQIAALTKQKESLADIQAKVAQLRGQIPEQQLLNQVFERISRAATSSGVTVTDASRGELEAFTARTGSKEGVAAVAAPAATPAPTPTTGAPIDAARDTAGQASANAAATDAQSGASPTSGSAAASSASARKQVQLTIKVTAPDIASTFAFLDDLRAGPRAIAIDTVTTTRSNAGFGMDITVIAFLQNSGGK